MNYIKKVFYKTHFTTKVYNCIAYRLELLKNWFKYKLPIITVKLFNKNIGFFILTPNHGNIGDTSIAFSIQTMLCEANVKYMELDISSFTVLLSNGWLNVLDKHPVFVNGGGNMGTIYPGAENWYRTLLTKCPNSKIIFFPNTIFYENTPFGKEDLENSKKIYNSHSKLVLYAREHISYDFMKSSYNDANIKLCPDMVLYLNYSDNTLKRDGCLLCLRNDVEKNVTQSDINMIEDFTVKNFSITNYTDTVEDDIVSAKIRENELIKKLNEFKGAQLVITDRLHGMIFCAITGTPCIVVNSKSPKVKGCYEWIKDLPYIKFCDNTEELQNIYSDIPPQGEFKFDNSSLLPFYNELKKDILNTQEKR